MNKLSFILLSLIVVLIAGIAVYSWRSGVFGVNQYQVQQSSEPNDSRDPADDQPATTEIAFMAVGDIMLSRNVAGQIAKNNKDGNYPFAKVSSQLADTDFNFGNLESPYSGSDSYNPSGSLVFNAPTWTLSGLINHNFKVLNLANNHGFDQGLDGLLYTKKLLSDNGILSLGVGQNLSEAWDGQVYTAKNIRVGFIGASYATLNDGGVATNNNVARIEQVAKLKQSIQDLRSRSDFVVVTMHAGTEYVRKPNAGQISFAQAAIDAGADLVIGAHPHWIQTFEQYKGKYIFYSLGNFVFDQMWSQDTKEGLMLKITLSKKSECTDNRKCDNSQQNQPAAALKQIQLLPVIIENYAQPRLANDTEAQTILEKIGANSPVITVE